MSNPYLKRHQKRRANKPLTSNEVGLRYGFRSGLEERIASELETVSVEFEFEETKLQYVKPQKTHTYTPDFYLPKQKIFIFYIVKYGFFKYTSCVLLLFCMIS